MQRKTKYVRRKPKYPWWVAILIVATIISFPAFSFFFLWLFGLYH